MLNYSQLHRLFEGRLQEAHTAGQTQGAGRIAALREFHDMLGMETHPTSGMPLIPKDERGMPVLKPGRINQREFCMSTLAEAIFGSRRSVEAVYGDSGSYASGVNLMEAAIDPSAFLNINTYNATIAGLVFAEVMERFNHPDYIGRNLVSIKPTNRNGDKLISVARMPSVTAAAKGRFPGEPHAEIGFSDAYQTTPETVEQALKCKVTREAAFFDTLTGQVLDEAGMVGDELGYGMEKSIADTFLGTTASYNRNGTSNNTYQTSSPWINDQVNPFTDETDIDDSRLLMVAMTDPETGKEIIVKSSDVYCMPHRELRFREHLFGTNVQLGTQPSSSFPSRWVMTTPKIGEVSGGSYTVTAFSQIWYNRATATDGLALSASDAQGLWFHGDSKGAFEWRENWPIQPWQANVDEMHMKDHGLIAVFGANYRGVAYSREPRKMIRNKAS